MAIGSKKDLEAYFVDIDGNTVYLSDFEGSYEIVDGILCVGDYEEGEGLRIDCEYDLHWGYKQK